MESLGPAIYILPAVLLGVPLLVTLLIAVRACLQKTPTDVTQAKYKRPPTTAIGSRVRDKSKEIRVA